MRGLGANEELPLVNVKTDLLNQWLSIVTNFGVIAGFVLVALQLQQNTEALRIQASAITASAAISAESAFMGDTVAEAYAIALRAPEDLTDAQILQASGYLSTYIVGPMAAYKQYSTGITTQNEWNRTRQSTAMSLNGRFAQAWWSATKPFFSPGFATEIDNELAQLPLGSGSEYIDHIKQAVARQRMDR